MADKWAVATGNWSSTATWNGGTLPTASDDVFADGFTVTIDQNVTVLSIQTTQRSGGTAGGGFTLSSGVTLTATIIAGTTTCITCAITTNQVASVIGNVNGSQLAVSGMVGINFTGSGVLNVTGNVTGYSHTASAGTNNQGMNISGTGTVNLVGNAISWTVANNNQTPVGISISAGTLNITGNVTAANSPLGGAGQPAGIAHTGGTITVNGSVTGGSITGITNSGSSSGIRSTGSGSITITGDIFGGETNGSMAAPGVLLGIGCTAFVSITGNLRPSSCQAIVCWDHRATVLINGNLLVSATGISGHAGKFLIHSTNILQHDYRTWTGTQVGTQRSLYTGGVNLNQPAVNNVRSGTVYGASNEFTGTCAVPPPSSVAFGVAVDNTTGLAAVTPSSIRAALGLASANLDTQLSQIAPSSIRGALGLASGNLDAQFTSLQSNSPSEFF